jgi:hypothetical protein
MAAIDDAIARLAARTLAQYLADSGYVEIFPPDLNAVATIGSYATTKAAEMVATAALVSASVAVAQALVGLTQKVGTEVLSLPRNIELGGAAFVDVEQLKGIVPSTQNAAYQILPQDFGKLLITTTGTNTWTLPVAADLPEGWWCLYRNRSSANLTVNRSGADTFNAAATTLAIATGTAIGWIIRTSSTTFEVG